MTVEDITRRAGPYLYVEGAQYPFAYKVFLPTHLLVTVTDSEDVDHVLDPEYYTVTLNSNQDLNAGGYVTLTSSISNAAKVTISSNVPYDQQSVMTNLGGFYPEVLNDVHDKIVIQIQQLKSDVARCLKVAMSSNVTPQRYLDDLIETFKDADNDIRAMAQSAINIATQALSSSVMGPAGPAGIQGPQGIQGEQGPQGPRGEAPRIDTIDCGHAPENQLIVIDGGQSDTDFEEANNANG